MSSIMVQGTTSSAGKSMLCTALCRIFVEDNLSVFPFKAQNMSSKSYITEDGLEISTAQALQATAAGLKPDPRMNPILLKPTGDRSSLVYLKGKLSENMDAVEYFKFKTSLRPMILETFEEVESEYDVVVIEGAGSPAEINLKENDIVNMGMAEMANSPVLLIADIDRGGVFASLYGTVMLLEEEERKRIKGLVINKFRGDISLLQSGIDMIEELLDIPVVGTIPYVHIELEDEDSLTDYEKKCNSSAQDEMEKIEQIKKLAKVVRENMDMEYIYSLLDINVGE
ncbi:cobyric acid synthase [Anaerosalibacter sp. Marseille-P3206]|uniref:cobyric acid synthase n=1 Tax=Anaerosalibacter sp. Marseille-P3206 TaxID=1871005 RepID=UPI00098591C9|nr:cobyric acid synthase [Anaerosalibacter sp. Marseille-P3206]